MKNAERMANVALAGQPLIGLFCAIREFRLCEMAQYFIRINHTYVV